MTVLTSAHFISLLQMLCPTGPPFRPGPVAAFHGLPGRLFGLALAALGLAGASSNGWRQVDPFATRRAAGERQAALAARMMMAAIRVWATLGLFLFYVPMRLCRAFFLGLS